MDYVFLGRGTGDARAKTMLNVLDALSGAVFSAMVTKGEDEYAVAVVAGTLRFTGRRASISCVSRRSPSRSWQSWCVTIGNTTLCFSTHLLAPVRVLEASSGQTRRFAR